ncbi:MAG: AsmA family protein [Rhodospirillales bacterium]|nr:AsmA family protein [Rhodospirillales bacterium]
MRKLWIAVGALAIVVLAAGLVAPSFIDWNVYKDRIADRVGTAIGRTVVIDGHLDASLLPVPRLRASEVSLLRRRGEGMPALATARELDIRLSWNALFAGRLEAASVRLVDPAIVLAVLADGRRNWDTDPEEAASVGAAPVAGGAAANIRLVRLTVENGHLEWRDARNGAHFALDRFDARLSADSLDGPLRANGSAAVGGLPFGFDATVGSLIGSRPTSVALNAELRPGLARFQYRGVFGRTSGRARIEGKLQVEGVNLVAALRPLDLAPRADALFAGALAQPFAFAGTVAAAANGVSANDLSLQLGDVNAGGAGSFAFGAPPVVDLALVVSSLDLDKLGAVRPAAEAAAPRTPSPPGAVLAVPKPPLTAVANALPDGFDATFDLMVDALALGGGIVRQVRINAALQRGDLIINQAAAQLPGGSDVSAFGQLSFVNGAPQVDGALDIASDNLRGFLGWLGMDAAAVPADRLRRFEGTARLRGPLSRLEIAGIDMRFDSSKLSGGVTLAWGRRPAFGADIRLDQFNLDAYWPPKRAAAVPTEPAQPRLAAAPAAGPTANGPGFADRFDAAMRLRIGSLTWDGQPIEGIVFDGTLRDGRLALTELAARDFVGATLRASGSLGRVTAGRWPATTLDVDLRSSDAGRVMRFAGLGGGPPGVALALKGRLATEDGANVTLDDLALRLGEMEIAGKVRLDLSGPQPKLIAELSGNEIRLDPLFAGAAAAPPPVAPFRPSIARAPALRPPPGRSPGGWSLERLDFGAWREFGGDVTLDARTLALGTMHLADAKLVASLAGGVFDIRRMTGALYGGRLDMTGTLDATGEPALRGRFRLDGADLKTALAALAGANAIGGRSDLTLDLATKGDSAAALIAGLNGQATLKSREATIDGLDLQAVGERLKRGGDAPLDIVTLARLGFGRGRTIFTALDGNFRIENGVVRTDDLRLIGPTGEGRTRGAIDLGRWAVDLASEFRLSELADMPPLALKLSGGLDSPRYVFDIDKMQGYMLRRGKP